MNDLHLDHDTVIETLESIWDLIKDTAKKPSVELAVEFLETVERTAGVEISSLDFSDRMLVDAVLELTDIDPYDDDDMGDD